MIERIPIQKTPPLDHESPAIRPHLVFWQPGSYSFPLSLEWLTPLVDKYIKSGEGIVHVLIEGGTNAHYMDIFDMGRMLIIANSCLENECRDFVLNSVTRHDEIKCEWVRDQTQTPTKHSKIEGSLLLEFTPIQLIDL